MTHRHRPVPRVRSARRARPLTSAVAAASALAVLAGCSGSGHKAASGPLTVSSVFADGAFIPIGYTCGSANESPPVTWSGVPSGTVEQAVVLEDLDVHPVPFVHWVISGLPPSLRSLARAAAPTGAVVSQDSSGQSAYFGPCPPSGATHHYRLTVYALRHKAQLTAGTTAAAAVAALNSDALAHASITGLFSR